MKQNQSKKIPPCMVSIILPTYNGARFIAQAIKSIQKQTYIEWELIIINDGSTDNTADVVTQYTKEDPRIKLINQKNSGQGCARKNAITHAQGTYIALIDDDDVWINPQKLELQVLFLEKNSHCILVGSSRTELINELGKHISWYENPEDDTAIRNIILLRNPFITSSVLFSKDVYEAVGGFSDMRLSEDYELWLKLGTHGNLANIPNAEVAYRIRSGSSSTSRKLALCANTLSLIIKNRKEYPHFLRAYSKGLLRFPYYLLKK